jgi:indole-3-glycerol phosphate synthase
VVKAYETWGAAGSSVLTDTNYFGGSLDDLSHSRNITSLPLLRKDFIIDELQVVEAKAHGADVILLIAAILSPERAEELASMARWFGMEVLLEIHEESELDRLNEYIDMVGVNNRDLRDFSVRIERSLELIQKLPAQLPAVSESGISDAVTIATLKSAGYKGFLVGENFMKQDDPAQAFQDFVNKLEK